MVILHVVKRARRVVYMGPDIPANIAATTIQNHPVMFVICLPVVAYVRSPSNKFS